VLEYRKEMYDSVEEKFLINGNKYRVHIKNQKEIDILKSYLDYDFILHESNKGFTGELIQDTEMIVVCDYKLSLVVLIESKSILGLTDFQKDVEKTLPLNVFIDKNPLKNHPALFI